MKPLAERGDLPQASAKHMAKALVAAASVFSVTRWHGRRGSDRLILAKAPRAGPLVMISMIVTAFDTGDRVV
jgi:hypothetical protein